MTTSIAQPFAALAFMAAASVATAALAADTKESRPVSGFSGIELAVPGKLEIIQDGTESLTIEGPAEVLAEIETLVRDGGKLVIRQRSRGNWPWHTKVKMVAHMKQVESVGISGSGDVYARTLRGARLTLAISGSGDIEVTALDADEAHIAISGSGDVHVAGRAASVASSVSGSGEIKAGKLEARKATVSIAGSGDVALWVRESLTVKIAGAGDVRYYGDPSIEKRIAGHGSIKRLGPAPT